MNKGGIDLTSRAHYRWNVRFAAILLTTLLAMTTVSATLSYTALPAYAQARGELRVTNHVFTTRVIRSADDSFFVQDVLVGFERGTASFQTLTQVVLPRGTHRIALALFDPRGRELSRINFPAIQAESDDWTQSLEGTWRDIRFNQSGVHELVVYFEGRTVARFHLVVA